MFTVNILENIKKQIEKIKITHNLTTKENDSHSWQSFSMEVHSHVNITLYDFI